MQWSPSLWNIIFTVDERWRRRRRWRRPQPPFSFNWMSWIELRVSRCNTYECNFIALQYLSREITSLTDVVCLVWNDRAWLRVLQFGIQHVLEDITLTSQNYVIWFSFIILFYSRAIISYDSRVNMNAELSHIKTHFWKKQYN